VIGSVEAVARSLDGAARVAVLCHIRPDADTLGSALALARVLRARGAQVSVSHPGTGSPGTESGGPAADVGLLPTGISMLAGSDGFSAPLANAVVVTVDCASAERTGVWREVFAAAETTVVIDHHATNSGFGTVNLVDPGANCTTELVLRIADALGADIDAGTADCLYAGLVTDTGSFRWSTPGGHGMAARLLAAGARGRELSRELLDSHPAAWLTLVAKVLATATVAGDAYGGRGVVHAVCTAADRGDLGWDAAESLIDLLRTVSDCEIAALLKEGEPGQWTASLRARTDGDVATLARTFGGGGHRAAAGYSDTGTAAEVVARLLDRV
jgi:phosphoesterase RecJ-like protein